MSTLFLATTGGHLEQLVSLAARVPEEGPAVWVTHENEQSRALLAGRDTVFVPYVRVGEVGDVARCVPTARRLLRTRSFTRAVSTGSGIALGYLPFLAARGVACHYIESAARVSAPSRTGRVLHHVPGIRRYTQHAGWAGRRWAYRGSVLDSYEPDSRTRPPGDVLRVVVTVGTAAEFPFGRLVDRLAPLLAPDGELARATGRPVDVLWQTGCTPIDHLPVAARPFLPGDELAEQVARADLVVSHAGVGSALTALAAGRRPLLVARSAALGEAGDDHQTQLATSLARRGLAVHRSPEDLTVEDLLEALTSGVRRSDTPLPFELLP
ncbi:glycosyl transferase family 28 [Blastococcus sp. TML/M2B]|uniref:glycosyltransferase n=1 Tax=unclassified Blastococcus TaxID=2619396 RepID=UPI00190CB948|nr:MULTISPECIES: glycosyltransferase [unclassified Blastococcus]MBN1091268.1 glycosyl transferase family 28 [Blastococcus sp. TML/M2B]MBN1095175.1 glycosyl transferase family 28 [Blastococcus sp. TML/C7B]